MQDKILIIGAARSGLACATYFNRKGNQVVLTDMKKVEDKAILQDLQKNNIFCIWGVQPDIEKIQPHMLIMSPGVPLSIEPVRQAIELGIPVLGELEVAYCNCKAPFIAITGTNGKTTTTTLIGELLEKNFVRVVVGGNIGYPLVDVVDTLQETDIVVAEVSSFQLETVQSFRPHIALILNITPDHLDRHGNMECYLETKAKIFCNQIETDYLVLNFDDRKIKELAAQSKGKVIFFSQKNILEEGVFLQNDQIILLMNGKKQSVCHRNELRIKGNHNLENAMGAIAVAYLSGVEVSEIAEKLRAFAGVEHRLEWVHTINDVHYINDSKGTNPDSTMKALEAYESPIILIAGGKNKGSDFGPLSAIIKEKVKHVILLGEAKEEIGKVLKMQGYNKYEFVSSLEEAVNQATEIAHAGDIVLLSPACASWDMFSSYEQRGQLFKEYVHQL